MPKPVTNTEINNNEPARTVDTNLSQISRAADGSLMRVDSFNDQPGQRQSMEKAEAVVQSQAEPAARRFTLSRLKNSLNLINQEPVTKLKQLVNDLGDLRELMHDLKELEDEPLNIHEKIQVLINKANRNEDLEKVELLYRLTSLILKNGELILNAHNNYLENPDKFNKRVHRDGYPETVNKLVNLIVLQKPKFDKLLAQKSETLTRKPLTLDHIYAERNDNEKAISMTLEEKRKFAYFHVPAAREDYTRAGHKQFAKDFERDAAYQLDQEMLKEHLETSEQKLAKIEPSYSRIVATLREEGLSEPQIADAVFAASQAALPELLEMFRVKLMEQIQRGELSLSDDFLTKLDMETFVVREPTGDLLERGTTVTLDTVNKTIVVAFKSNSAKAAEHFFEGDFQGTVTYNYRNGSTSTQIHQLSITNSFSNDSVESKLPILRA